MIDTQCAQNLTTGSIAGDGADEDASPRVFGRDQDGVNRLARQAPMHFSMVTGRHERLPAKRLGSDQTVEAPRNEFMDEVQHGVGVHRVRSRAIKFRTSFDIIVPSAARAARAAAQAQLITRLLITAHTDAGTMGMQQLDLIYLEGA